MQFQRYYNEKREFIEVELNERFSQAEEVKNLKSEIISQEY
jgi:hypothetical protein